MICTICGCFFQTSVDLIDGMVDNVCCECQDEIEREEAEKGGDA